MARYLAILEVTSNAFKGFIRNPEDRKQATETLFSSIGRTVEHYWFGVGSNTLYIVTDGPEDNVNIEAITMLVGSSGIVQSMEMVKLMTSEEAVVAMKKASDLAYRPPGS